VNKVEFKEGDLQKWKDYFEKKFSWYADRIKEIKDLAEGSDISMKDYNIVSKVELVNLEIATDQIYLADLMFSGANGALLKKLELFEKLLTNIGYRTNFYIQTRVRGF
jgi:hypothetical protein